MKKERFLCFSYPMPNRRGKVPCNKRNVSCTELWKYIAEDVGWRASCSNAQAFANRMSRASVTGANCNARMSANPFETESI